MNNIFTWKGLTCKTAEIALTKKYGSKVGHIDMLVKAEDNVWVASNEFGDEWRIVTGKGYDGTMKYFY